MVSYIRHSKAWYATDEIDDHITLVIEKGGDLIGECKINQVRRIGTRLEIFDDAFHILPHLEDLFESLSNWGKMSLDDVEAVLQDIGYTDQTDTTVPPREAAYCFSIRWTNVFPMGDVEDTNDPLILSVKGHPRWEGRKKYQMSEEPLKILTEFDDGWGTHPEGDREIQEALADYEIDN